eukprot:GHVU01121817.1.p2 GENE.GHVU01121817.1~~GHVU01121817.1.p2  ORF type:complete len:145 (-),score=14.77 GHVU01121817.1:149-583(-)
MSRRGVYEDEKNRNKQADMYTPRIISRRPMSRSQCMHSDAFMHTCSPPVPSHRHLRHLLPHPSHTHTASSPTHLHEPGEELPVLYQRLPLRSIELHVDALQRLHRQTRLPALHDRQRTNKQASKRIEIVELTIRYILSMSPTGK